MTAEERFALAWQRLVSLNERTKTAAAMLNDLAAAEGWTAEQHAEALSRFLTSPAWQRKT